jgi:RimJ/RimL family protein N-acetyltransferase
MTFDLQPVLTGKLIELRPLLQTDFEELYHCASDNLIWELHPQSNRHQKEIFHHFFEDALASHGAFAAFDKLTQEMIGTSRYYRFDNRKKQVMIGYTFLVRSRWGGKYNREMKNLMLDHAFQFVDRVLFEIGVGNFRSRRAIEKLGALLLPGEVLLDGKPHVVYAIDKDL